MSRLVIVTAACALLGSACVSTRPHVELAAAPGHDDAFDARAGYYKKHAPNAYNGQSVLLHGGERIYYPEDLLPAVDADSPTAKAIKQHVDARERLEKNAPPIVIPAAVGTLGGLTVMCLSPVFLAIEGDVGDTLAFGGMAVGGIAAGIGTILAISAPIFLGEDERQMAEATDTVLRTYSQSLVDRVGVQPDADGMLIDLTMKEQGPRKAASGARDL